MLVVPIAIAILVLILLIIFIYKKRDCRAGEVMLPFSKKKMKQVITDFENTNGNKLRDFSLKEITIMFHDDISRRCEKIEQTIDDHLKDSHIREQNGLTIVAEQGKLIQRITSQLDTIARDMPSKGFCDNVNKMYNEFYPANDESLSDKVKTLWYDRKIMKWILATSVGALLIGIITLGIGFMKGVF